MDEDAYQEQTEQAIERGKTEMAFAEKLYYATWYTKGPLGETQEDLLVGTYKPTNTGFIPMFTTNEKAAGYLWSIGFSAEDSSIYALGPEHIEAVMENLPKHVEALGLDLPISPERMFPALEIEALVEWSKGELV